MGDLRSRKLLYTPLGMCKRHIPYTHFGKDPTGGPLSARLRSYETNIFPFGIWAVSWEALKHRFRAILLGVAKWAQMAYTPHDNAALGPLDLNAYIAPNCVHCHRQRPVTAGRPSTQQKSPLGHSRANKRETGPERQVKRPPSVG